LIESSPLLIYQKTWIGCYLWDVLRLVTCWLKVVY